MHRWIAPLLTLAISAPALASTAANPVLSEDEPPPVILKHIPPRTSWSGEFAVGYVYNGTFQISEHFAGLGGRFTWGRHIENHRIGIGMSAGVQGAVLSEWLTSFGVYAHYETIAARSLLLGASLGPDLVLRSEWKARSNGEYDTTVHVAPRVAGRIGWSTPFSRLARRTFVAFEGEFRWVAGAPAAAGYIVVGSGWANR